MSEQFAGESSGSVTPGENAQPQRRRSRAQSFWQILRDIAVIVVVALLVSFLMRTFVVRVFYIPSASMQPTLEVEDRILVEQLTGTIFEVSHGDVIVFRDPGGWLGPQNPDVLDRDFFDHIGTFLGLGEDTTGYLVKRVVGLPGDVVACCNGFGQLTVNGIPIVEDYLKLPPGTTKVSGLDFTITVPENSLWVLGDNRYNSGDSRYNQHKPGGGFVPTDNVVGKAMLIVSPFERWQIVDSHADAYSGVKDAGAED